MATLFFSGLETGDASEWTSTVGSVNFSPPSPRSGRFALSVLCNNTNTLAKTGLGANTNAAFRVAIYPVVTTFSSTGAFLNFVMLVDGTVLAVRLQGRLVSASSVELRVSSITGSSSAVAISAAAWHVVEVWATRSDAAGTISWNVDGVAQTGLSSTDTLGDGTGYAEFRIGTQFDVLNTWAVRLDDTFLTNQNAAPGDGKCIGSQGTIADETPTYNTWTIATVPVLKIESVWSEVPFGLALFATSPGAGDPLAQTMNTLDVDTPTSGAVLLSQPDAPATVNLQGGTAGSGETSQARGQGFTLGTTAAVRAIGVNLNKTGDPTDSLQIDIVSGSIDGTVLATSLTVHNDRCVVIPGIATNWFAPFTSPVTLTGGTEYFLRITRTGGRDVTNHYLISVTTVSAITGSNYVRDNNVWSVVDANDLAFVIYESGGSIAASDTINACKLSAWAFRGTGGSRTHQLRYRLDTTDTSETKTLTTGDAFYETAIFTTTFANLNLAQIGGNKSGGAAGQNMNIDDCWLMVDYLPVAAAAGRRLFPLLGVGP